MSLIGKKKITPEQAYIEAMIFMIFADGSAEASEKQQLYDELASRPTLSNIPPQELNDMFSTAMKEMGKMFNQLNRGVLSSRFQELADALPSAATRMDVLETCLRIAKANGRLDIGEEELFILLGASFGFSKDQLQELVKKHFTETKSF